MTTTKQVFSVEGSNYEECVANFMMKFANAIQDLALSLEDEDYIQEMGSYLKEGNHLSYREAIKVAGILTMTNPK